MNRSDEVEHLRRADSDIAQARERVHRQLELIARLENHGHDVSSAMSMLATMRETLRLMEAHRELIITELAR